MIKIIFYGLLLALFALTKGDAAPFMSHSQWMQQWVAARPAASVGMDYWSADFYSQASGWNLQFVPAGYFEMDDMTGPWANIEHGIRRTTGQLDGAAHTLYLMGNSTLYGLFVADKDTIASSLQADIGPSYKVINLGGTGRTTLHQLHLLKTLPVKRGDIVVWLDGLMETEAIYGASNSGELLQDTVWLNKQIEGQVKQFRQAVTEGYQWSATHGAAFYHFTQPHLWSMPLSEIEKGATAYPLIERRDLSIPRIYAAIERELPTLPGTEVSLLHVLDAERTAGYVLYFDCCHLNPRGHRLIARQIFDQISIF